MVRCSQARGKGGYREVVSSAVIINNIKHLTLINKLNNYNYKCTFRDSGVNNPPTLYQYFESRKERKFFLTSERKIVNKKNIL